MPHSRTAKPKRALKCISCVGWLVGLGGEMSNRVHVKTQRNTQTPTNSHKTNPITSAHIPPQLYNIIQTDRTELPSGFRFGALDVPISILQVECGLNGYLIHLTIRSPRLELEIIVNMCVRRAKETLYEKHLCSAVRIRSKYVLR